ncbi:MAG: hypothetical protein J0H17_08145 [Rhizobiales bacterium]|nr:hypothetical protein [Hyphomicrobiales bacterium]
MRRNFRNPKVAPPRGNAAYEEEDGQRLSANLDLPLVQDDEHMERLQLQMLNRSRREIRHKVPLPPSCFGLEAGDIVAWTSSRNGYTAKLFEVDSNELFYNLNSAPALIEVDPSDHDWDKGTDYVAQPAVSLTVDRPAPKVITGFDVEAIKVTGDNGVEKPGLRISWDAPEDGDVNAVQWQYRRTSAPDDVAEGKTNDVAALQVLLVGGFSSLTSYDTRARLESFNGYAADWSLWATVTTPQCGETNLSVLTTEVNDLIAGGQKRLQDALQEAQQLIASLATGQDAANHLEAVETRRLLSVERDDRKASVEEVMTVAVGVDTALAAYEVTVNAHLGALDSSVSTNAGAITTLDSAFSSYQTTVNAHLGTLDSSVSTNASAIADINGNLAAKYALTVDANGNIAAMELIAGGSGSAVRFRSDIFEIAINGSPTGYAVFTVANVSGTPTVTIRGSVIADEFLVKRMIGDDQVDYDKLETGAAAALADAAHSTINVLSAWTSGLPADWRDVVSTTITTVTGDIEIFYYANHFTYLRNTTTGQRIVVQVRVLVDGVAAETFDLVTDEIASGKYYFDKPIFLPSFKTGLSAGSHTITIQSQRGFGTWGTADADNEFSAGRVRVNELRKAA